MYQVPVAEQPLTSSARSILQADNALCAAGAALIIAVNFGGFAVVHTLHRQIKHVESDPCRCRLASSARKADLLPTSCQPGRFHIIEAITESHTARRGQSPGIEVTVGPETREGSPKPRRKQSTAAAEEAGAALGHSGAEGLEPTSPPSREAPVGADLSAGALRRLALDGSPVNSAARHKAMRLLELRKAERDVFALLVAIVLMASMCLGIALWVAISPTSVYADWTT